MYNAFFKKNYQYIFIFFVFLLVLFNHYFIIPSETEEVKSEKGIPSEIPFLDNKDTEKAYKNILQSKQGDVFRVGFFVKADHDQVLEVFLESALNEKLKVGEIAVSDSGEWEYKELVFVTPDRYDSLAISLKQGELISRKWDNKVVYLESFLITRIDIDKSRIATLSPTISDVSGIERARLEDIGGAYLYTYSYQNKEIDYQNLFDSSGTVHFDDDDRIVVGEGKRSEFFTYKFDTFYPFEKFVFQAVQDGKSSKELHLEYSFDNSFWREISYAQEKGDHQEFFLTIHGNQKEKTVYIRTTYDGDEKKKKTFGLAEFSVMATIQKAPKN
ncbi:MAG: hypothetical protein A2808_01120 [Candidatus Moranbacteria bacterium RIFCSPHIGHO2_01_FULL_55_24]|nr:MAG: hypothetical protein A2808_01120 [Candidatus Moranbacteria bacterium RIFCSPHIGHO2_01_FULL_55_24]